MGSHCLLQVAGQGPCKAQVAARATPCHIIRSRCLSIHYHSCRASEHSPPQVPTASVQLISQGLFKAQRALPWELHADHEVVGTIDDESGPSYVVNLANSRTMTLHRVRSIGGGTCPNPLNIHTGTIDGAVVYSPHIIFEKKLRDLPGCHLREGDQPGFLPLTTTADDQGRFFIVAGDGRVDEHAALTSMHTVRLCIPALLQTSVLTRHVCDCFLSTLCNTVETRAAVDARAQQAL